MHKKNYSITFYVRLYRRNAIDDGYVNLCGYNGRTNFCNSMHSVRKSPKLFFFIKWKERKDSIDSFMHYMLCVMQKSVLRLLRFKFLYVLWI